VKYDRVMTSLCSLAWIAVHLQFVMTMLERKATVAALHHGAPVN